MRALFRRQLWRTLHRPLLRYQHDLPHKEYFQNPGQTPLPDATPYAPPPAFPSPPSYFRRGLRSVTWATLFGTLGFAGGVGLLTWDYLQPPFELGSEEDQEMLEEIEAMMDNHPLIQGLREEGWTEKTYQHSNRLLQTLSGTQGMTMKGFQMSSTGYTILCFYTGNGLEGWPDIIHGGLITTLFDEAALLHIRGPGSQESAWTPPYQIDVDFKESIRPGEIYSILLPPAVWNEKFDVTLGKSVTGAGTTFQGLLLRLEDPPQVSIDIDQVTQAKMHHVVFRTRNMNDSEVIAHAKFYFSSPTVQPVPEDEP